MSDHSEIIAWTGWAEQVRSTLDLELELGAEHVYPPDGPSVQHRFTAYLYLSTPRDGDSPQRASARRTRGAQANALGSRAGWTTDPDGYAYVAQWLDGAAYSARELAKTLPELLLTGDRNPEHARLEALAARWEAERDELRIASR